VFSWLLFFSHFCFSLQCIVVIYVDAVICGHGLCMQWLPPLNRVLFSSYSSDNQLSSFHSL
jgi:hypothetical protein